MLFDKQTVKAAISIATKKDDFAIVAIPSEPNPHLLVTDNHQAYKLVSQWPLSAVQDFPAVPGHAAPDNGAPSPSPSPSPAPPPTPPLVAVVVTPDELVDALKRVKGADTPTHGTIGIFPAPKSEPVQDDSVYPESSHRSCCIVVINPRTKLSSITAESELDTDYRLLPSTLPEKMKEAAAHPEVMEEPGSALSTVDLTLSTVVLEKLVKSLKAKKCELVRFRFRPSKPGDTAELLAVDEFPIGVSAISEDVPLGSGNPDFEGVLMPVRLM